MDRKARMEGTHEGRGDLGPDRPPGMRDESNSAINSGPSVRHRLARDVPLRLLSNINQVYPNTKSDIPGDAGVPGSTLIPTRVVAKVRKAINPKSNR